MDTKIKNYLAISIILSLFVLASISFWYVSSFSESILPQRSFSVSGEGKVVTIPDVAEFSFTIVTEGGKNLANLQKENSEKANQIISFLKENDTDPKDIKTQYYNISPRYQYSSCPGAETVTVCPPPEIVGYTITQGISVKIRRIDKAGDILSGVVERGTNTVSGPNFVVDDPTNFQNQAREQAINKAKEKAKTIAKAGDFKLGKLISITEGLSYPPIFFAESADFAKIGAMETPTIEPGSQEIKITATLTYEIK